MTRAYGRDFQANNSGSTLPLCLEGPGLADTSDPGPTIYEASAGGRTPVSPTEQGTFREYNPDQTRLLGILGVTARP